MSQTVVLLTETCRMYLLFILACSVWGKARSMDAFRMTVGALLGLNGERVIKAIAYMVLLGELAAALLLIPGGAFAWAGAMLATCMFAAFTIALAAVLYQGRVVQCHCFGASQYPVSALDLFRNALLIAAGVFCLLNAGAFGAADPAAYPFLAGLALLLALLTVSINDIAFIIRMSHAVQRQQDIEP